MSTRHTEGPWSFRKNYGETLDLFGADGATVILNNARLMNQNPNARLIAAAPDLLEALIDCRRALELANFTQELVVVNAAIAKATGETK